MPRPLRLSPSRTFLTEGTELPRDWVGTGTSPLVADRNGVMRVVQVTGSGAIA